MTTKHKNPLEGYEFAAAQSRERALEELGWHVGDLVHDQVTFAGPKINEVAALRIIEQVLGGTEVPLALRTPIQVYPDLTATYPQWDSSDGEGL